MRSRMMLENHERLTFTAMQQDYALPLFMESLGDYRTQEAIHRPEGYPLYHWLQTTAGEGKLTCGCMTYSLPIGSGFLLPPQIGHSYGPCGTEMWHTQYVTFGGALAQPLLTQIGMNQPIKIVWDKADPCDSYLRKTLDLALETPDIFGLESSSQLYGFMLSLHQYGQRHRKQGITGNLDKLQPLLQMMEERLHVPDLGLQQMAEVVDLSGRRLNSLFRETFRMPPYAYLLMLRIRRAKELLVEQRLLKVKEVAEQVGFRDVSHFVASFRQATGMTPEQYRRLN